MPTFQQRAASIFAGLTFRLVLLGIIALLLVNTYADIKLKGPLGIGFHFEGWKPKAQRYKRTIDDFDQAQADALKAAQEAKERAEQDYRELAERIDNDAEKARAGHMDDAERFIAANRVRCAPDRRAGSGAVAPATDNGTGSGESSGQAAELDEAVAVTADDVRICTVNTLQAEAAREWALELERVE